MSAHSNAVSMYLIRYMMHVILHVEEIKLKDVVELYFQMVQNREMK